MTRQTRTFVPIRILTFSPRTRITSACERKHRDKVGTVGVEEVWRLNDPGVYVMSGYECDEDSVQTS